MYRFGGVEVDPRAREVRRDGHVEHLEPQAFDLLVHLIDRRHDVVAKHDLLDGVWGHRFVSEAALTTRVKEIRRAVGDDGATQHTIRNVRGRGYRFVAELDDGAGRAAAAGTDLVGRRDELAEVLRRVGSSPLVTLVGPGGVGKSTLARAALRTLAASAPDGVHVVELAPLETGEQVMPALARMLDIAFDPARPHLAAASIARLDAVLLLDNCEHVVDAAADGVDRMIATPGSRVRVLATSQLRLGVTGEQVIGLAPLPADEARTLFDTRARAVQPAWRIDEVGPDRVDALVDQLDRLPLMIEMAAARLATMTFGDVEHAVGEAGRLVQLTHRTPTRRHRTLGSLVEWSADLLPGRERRAFVDFAVFAGSVSAADAALVLGDGAADAVGDLAERSLLAVDLTGGTATYRMLDTVKGVARRWLADDASHDSVHRRHAVAFAEQAAEIDRLLRSPDELSGRRRLDRIVAEIRQAHRWARDHDPQLADRLGAALHVASYGRLWGEPAAWSRALLDLDGGPYLGARLLVGGAATHEGDLETARAVVEEVLGATTDPQLLGIAHEILSDAAIYSGRLDDCAEHSAELAALGAELGDSHMRAIATVNESLLLTFGGDPRGGLDHVASEAGEDMSPSSLAWLAYGRGEALAQLAEHDDAAAAFDDAIELAGSVANPFVVSVAQSALAADHARRGARADAYAVYADCLRGYLRHGNLVHSVTTLRNLVSLLHADGDQRGAAVLGIATSNDGVRPPYGAESEALGDVLAEIESAVWPDRFADWADEARGLDLDGAVRRALALVEGHRAGTRR